MQQWFRLTVKATTSSALQKNRKLKNKSAFVFRKYIKWLTYTESQFFQAVCTLKFQAYGHGNSYQYSKAIEDVGDIQKGPAQSNKAVNQVPWHMLTRQFAVCHRGWMELKAKLWTHRGDRHCSDRAQGAFSDSCNTDYIVWRPIKRGKWREQPCRTHTMHKWWQGEEHFGMQSLTHGKLSGIVSSFVKLKSTCFMKKVTNNNLLLSQKAINQSIT